LSETSYLNKVPARWNWRIVFTARALGCGLFRQASEGLGSRGPSAHNCEVAHCRLVEHKRPDARFICFDIDCVALVVGAHGKAGLGLGKAAFGIAVISHAPRSGLVMPSAVGVFTVVLVTDKVGCEHWGASRPRHRHPIVRLSETSYLNKVPARWNWRIVFTARALGCGLFRQASEGLGSRGPSAHNCEVAHCRLVEHKRPDARFICFDIDCVALVVGAHGKAGLGLGKAAFGIAVTSHAPRSGLVMPTAVGVAVVAHAFSGGGGGGGVPVMSAFVMV